MKSSVPAYFIFFYRQDFEGNVFGNETRYQFKSIKFHRFFLGASVVVLFDGSV